MNKSKNCSKCGNSFDYEAVFMSGREIFTPAFCEPCFKIEDEETAKAEKARQEAMQLREWESICPREYRETDVSRLLPAYRHALTRWKYGKRGVGIPGVAGTGKTRTAFLLLKKSHFEHKRSCFAISAKRLADLSIEQFDRQEDVKFFAKTTLRRAHSTDVLLIDDLGKGTMSERPEEELYAILEDRTSRQKPTIWTANSNGNELLSKFSQDRGEAILRRLTEFSEIV
jgi:DNA replication protein DnaC